MANGPATVTLEVSDELAELIRRCNPEPGKVVMLEPGQKPPLPGLKFDNGKLDLSLLPLDFVACLVPVFAHGEKEYGFENWRLPFDSVERRAIAALKRHLMECERDPLAINEKDGGVYHLAQVAWNALWLLFQLTNERAPDAKP